MSKRRKVALAVPLVLCAAVLLWAFLPRSFQQASHVPLKQVTRIGVCLHPTKVPTEGYYTLSLLPEDPAFKQLLELLESKKYFPMVPGNRGRLLLLDYHVSIDFLLTDRDGAYWGFGTYFTGDQPIQIGQRDYTVSGSKAFQQAVLDLLLAQEPEFVPND